MKSYLKTSDRINGIVYMIKNKIDGKAYIGITGRKFTQRYVGGWWKRTNNKYLQNAAQKYGKDAFEIIFLEEDVSSYEWLVNIEHYYIKTLNTLAPNGYNFSDGGLGAKKLHPEQIERMRELSSQPFRIKKISTGKIIEGTNLKKFAEENNLNYCALNHMVHKRQLRPNQPCLSSQGYCLPETTIEELKQRGKRSNKWKVYTFISPDGKEYTTSNLQEFCKEHNLCKDGMNLLAKNKIFTSHGWRKKNNTNHPKFIENHVGKKLMNVKTNEIVIIDNFVNFCKKRKYDLRYFGAFLRGEYKTAYGFKVFE